MLRIENLRKSYDTFRLDCSMEVLSGRVTGLVGQNGAGKSTTFKAVLGLIRPDGGRIEILGKDSAQFGAKDKEKLGVVLSNAGFSGYLTIKDIVPVMASLYARFDRGFFLEQVRRFGLPEIGRASCRERV